ncbi:MAG: ATP synthase F0 subunit A [Desulfobacteraceae bacterium]|nr:MAG: ATP synthase F0 subunit A [Desulfobacteraceae bacterium]
MEHPYLFLTKLCEMLGEGASHFGHAYPHVTYMWLAMIILIFFGWLAGKGVTLVPKTAQSVFEVLLSGLEEFMVTITGEEGRKFFPLAATLFLFILLSNLMGLVPGFFPPTASLNTTAACAVIAVTWTHILGVRYHGAHYIKHFLGPVPAMIPLIFPIELIGHAARILSLSFRLFGNMMGHELVVGILLMLAGLYLAPLPIMALGIFVALVQAFVFFLLSVMYFAGAIEEAH